MLNKKHAQKKKYKSDVCLHVIDAIIGEEVSINKKSYPNKLQNRDEMLHTITNEFLQDSYPTTRD